MCIGLNALRLILSHQAKSLQYNYVASFLKVYMIACMCILMCFTAVFMSAYATVYVCTYIKCMSLISFPGNRCVWCSVQQLVNARFMSISYITDVNVAFRQAMIKIGMDHEELAKQFELIVTTPTSELGKAPARSKRKTSAWRYIGLAHTVSWPLHVVFTPAALEKYGLYSC